MPEKKACFAFFTSCFPPETCIVDFDRPCDWLLTLRSITPNQYRKQSQWTQTVTFIHFLYSATGN